MGKADVQQVEPQWAIAAKVLKICVVAQLVIAICIIELENNSFNGGGNLAILCILQTDGKMDMAKTPKIRWIFGEFVNAETFLLWYNNLYEG